MSRKENKEEEGREMILDHGSHVHPLSLTECSKGRPCYVCGRYIVFGEMVYGCHKKCGWYGLFHEDCAEMPQEIRLSMHDPKHTLVQKKVPELHPCAVCERHIKWGLGYHCSSCTFKIHVKCAPNMGLLESCINHPSHPHQLSLMRRPGRSCSSRCDACSTIHKGSPYVCAPCQYWVLESCANLPATAHFQHLHHHPLSLAFSLPTEYIRFQFFCAICYKGFFRKYWVYHCGICRYVVHINCVITTMRNIHLEVQDEAADKDVIVFPIHNVGEELIGPFVTKVVGAKVVPNDNEIGISKYKFHNHHHQLHLIPFPLHNHEEEDRGIGDDELNCRRRSELICDGCVTPIFEKKQKSECNYYMRCSECDYFLHWACFNLPPDLPSHPLHLRSNHTLILRTPPKLASTECDICLLDTNGLIYECTKCSFKIDIKCASLPDTMKHASHVRHLFKLLGRQRIIETVFGRGPCVACGNDTDMDVSYKCEICEISMHASCALLPTRVNNPTWDSHPFPLTFDASIDHPSDFYCAVCEIEMNPKWWMYHCRTCDFSFHSNCFPATSYAFRNIVFGQRYDVGTVHNHPLVYQLLTSKLYCDVCAERKKYGCPGFQCASHGCDFFMCFNTCGRSRRHTFEAVHQFRLTL